ncbi:MAG: zinc ABC transporter substrate-binding protein [Bacillaceae bacterium]|nr:zinc ABC transporter substrate-binding protein [Bacillaceae bacterium]
MKHKISIFAVLLILTLFLAACGTKEDGKEEVDAGEVTHKEFEETLKVYTTIFPLQDFVSKIGGEHVEVNNVVPVGADAHTFEPSPRTMVDITKADLYIYNGLGIEGFADAVADVLANESVKIVRASDGVELIDYDHGHDDLDHDHDHDDHGHDDHDHDHDHDDHDDHGHNHDHGDEDPHIWLDPLRSIKVAENIKNALIDLRPEAKEDFEQNFAALQTELEQLDQEFKEMITEVPNNTIVVSHAGYGYWTNRYGIQQVGISGISPTNEPSIRQLQDIIEFVKENKINYIMMEQNIPTNITNTVITHVGGEALLLHNLEALTSEDVDNNEDYFSLMRRNIDVLRIALQ